MNNSGKLIYKDNYEVLKKILPDLAERNAYRRNESIELNNQLLSIENLAQDAQKRCSRISLTLFTMQHGNHYEESTTVEIMIEHMVGLAIGHSYVHGGVGDCSYPNDLLREWLSHVSILGMVLPSGKPPSLSERIRKITPGIFRTATN